MSSWEIKEGEEQISRDIERAEEYQQLTARATVISANKFELSTGLTIAARYADKLRRVAIVALGKIVPRDVIIRDIANLNKILYEELVNKMKVDKLEVVRIVVDVIYDQASNKLNFENIRISRYYSEEKIKSIIKEYEDKINSLEEENKKLKNEINSLQTQLNNIKEVLNKIAQALESVK
jgi:hypothetical protein